MKSLMVACLLLLSTSGLATFLPENDLHLQEANFEASDMTQAEFNRIVDQVIAAYAPDALKYGGKLVGNKLWDNATVNASANQSGTTWNVNMYGGLARRGEVTKDGFALVVCHEVGHHLGGFPNYKGTWASSEGQADYFATQACARRIWKGTAAPADVDDLAKAKCDQTWPTTADRNLCYRVAMAGDSLALLLSALGGDRVPEFGTPDLSKVTATVPSHPRGQCRLDTYFAGAVCPVYLRSGFAPGKDNPNGQDSKQAEYEMLGNSCTNRPRCWFAPGI